MTKINAWKVLKRLGLHSMSNQFDCVFHPLPSETTYLQNSKSHVSWRWFFYDYVENSFQFIGFPLVEWMIIWASNEFFSLFHWMGMQLSIQQGVHLFKCVLISLGQNGINVLKSEYQ